ncbi:hypothetical protein, partial [Rhodomicrobium udaipurense]
MINDGAAYGTEFRLPKDTWMNPDDLRVGLWHRGAQDRLQGDPFGGDTDPENPVWDDLIRSPVMRDKQA